MRIAYLDCFSGISGDMLLGALLDAGLDQEDLLRELAKLPVDGWHIEVNKILRRGISATDVLISESHHHNDNHPSHQPHPSHHDHDHHHHGRSLRELLAIIAESSLDPDIKNDASTVFRRIGEAEAKIHGTTPDEIHFHEVGGLDSLIDIVGCVAGLRLLGIQELHASRLPLSHGFIHIAHGKFPVPGPATTELLRGAPWYQTDIEGELITPTGAGILASFCKSFGNPPPFVIDRVGYGSGKTDFEHPNVLRLILGKRLEPETDLHVETLNLIETNIDDMNPEFYDHIFDRAFALGARDVFLTPIIMKKSRPAQLLSILADTDLVGPIIDCVLQETTTLGIRVTQVVRHSLDREIVPVETPFGTVRVKLSKRGTNVLRGVPEYQDCRTLAEKNQVALGDVYKAAQAAASGLVTNQSVKESDETT